ASGSLPGERGRVLRGGPARVSQEGDPRPATPARERIRGGREPEDLGTYVLPILDGRQAVPLTNRDACRQTLRQNCRGQVGPARPRVLSIGRPSSATPPGCDQGRASSRDGEDLARALLPSSGDWGRSSDEGGKDMGTHMKAVLCLLLLVGASCSREGENPVAPDATPLPASPPRIRSVVVVPSAIARGGTAQVRVDAFDPGGATVVCSFSEDAGLISIPDPAGGPCVGAYTNDGKARTSDTITIVATGAAKLSATATASVTLTGAEVVSPTPPPSPAPTPAPSPSPTLPPPAVTTQPATSI